MSINKDEINPDDDFPTGDPPVKEHHTEMDSQLSQPMTVKKDENGLSEDKMCDGELIAENLNNFVPNGRKDSSEYNSTEKNQKQPPESPVKDCGRLRTTGATKESHDIIFHLEEGIQCPKCGKLYTSQQQMKYHTENHPLVKRWTCRLCNKTFRYHNRLKQHNIRVHSQDSVDFTCYSCHQPFSSVGGLRRHITILHLNPNPMRVKYPCALCKASYSRSYDLNLHIKRVHSTNTPVKYICYHCNKSYQHKCGLESHIKHNHIVGYKMRYVCHSCGRLYSDRSNLNKHVRAAHALHKPERKVCSVCTGTFANNRNLNRHMRAIHGLLPKGTLDNLECS